jgi:hypothetical protein
MITATIKYDAKNANAKKALDLLLSLNLVYIEHSKKTAKKSGIEIALEDVRKGNVHRLITPKRK